MSEFEKDEFEKELTNKVSPHGRTFDGHELFLDIVLLEHFENWQPHKRRSSHGALCPAACGPVLHS